MFFFLWFKNAGIEPSVHGAGNSTTVPGSIVGVSALAFIGGTSIAESYIDPKPVRKIFLVLGGTLEIASGPCYVTSVLTRNFFSPLTCWLGFSGLCIHGVESGLRNLVDNTPI